MLELFELESLFKEGKGEEKKQIDMVVNLWCLNLYIFLHYRPTHKIRKFESDLDSVMLDIGLTNPKDMLSYVGENVIGLKKVIYNEKWPINIMINN